MEVRFNFKKISNGLTNQIFCLVSYGNKSTEMEYHPNPNHVWLPKKWNGITQAAKSWMLAGSHTCWCPWPAKHRQPHVLLNTVWCTRDITAWPPLSGMEHIRQRLGEVAPSQRRWWQARTLQWRHSRRQWWAKPAATAKCQRRRWARMPSQPGTHGGCDLWGLSASNPILQDPEGEDYIGRDLTSPSYVPIPWKVDAIPIPNPNSIQTSDIQKIQFQFPIL